MNDMKQFDMESFFYLLNEDEKKLVMERMHKESFSMGEYVFKEDDTGKRLYVVEKGAVSSLSPLVTIWIKRYSSRLRDRYLENSVS